MKNNKIHLTPYFYKKAKRLLKKYKTLGESLAALEGDLLENPQIGNSYGANIYKVRIADASKGTGKSGGFRVITYLVKESEDGTDIYLITIFDKSEEASIKKEDVIKIIKSLDI
ncbi:type II toxin-antitoxin system RelE/ParE family toxin [Parapedobacter sp. 2B3]|uniref:type II toxin-antitoxin system RelE/ParE family toxin n=1 Tax=Parapedobacter sp. 2B3 TaxID=3342381 RepID=UPI0035B5D33D